MGKTMPVGDSWTQVVWPFDADAAKSIQPVYSKKVGRVTFFLYPTQVSEMSSEEHKARYEGTWSYVASAGANSDLSHSGLVLEKDLNAAKLYCEQRVPTR